MNKNTIKVWLQSRDILLGEKEQAKFKLGVIILGK